MPVDWQVLHRCYLYLPHQPGKTCIVPKWPASLYMRPKTSTSYMTDLWSRIMGFSFAWGWTNRLYPCCIYSLVELNPMFINPSKINTVYTPILHWLYPGKLHWCTWCCLKWLHLALLSNAIYRALTMFLCEWYDILYKRSVELSDKLVFLLPPQRN